MIKEKKRDYKNALHFELAFKLYTVGAIHESPVGNKCRKRNVNAHKIINI